MNNILEAIQEDVNRTAVIGFPDLIKRFVLLKGKAYEAQALPKPFKKMKAKECFRNAVQMAFSNHDLRYVEGVGLSRIGFMADHAWCVDAGGRVIDPTWDDPEKCQYAGVEFSLEVLENQIFSNGYYGLLQGPVLINYDFMVSIAPELEQALEEVKASKGKAMKMLESYKHSVKG